MIKSILEWKRTRPSSMIWRQRWRSIRTRTWRWWSWSTCRRCPAGFTIASRCWRRRPIRCPRRRCWITTRSVLTNTTIITLTPSFEPPGSPRAIRRGAKWLRGRDRVAQGGGDQGVEGEEGTNAGQLSIIMIINHNSIIISRSWTRSSMIASSKCKPNKCETHPKSSSTSPPITTSVRRLSTMSMHMLRFLFN